MTERDSYIMGLGSRLSTGIRKFVSDNYGDDITRAEFNAIIDQRIEMMADEMTDSVATGDYNDAIRVGRNVWSRTRVINAAIRQARRSLANDADAREAAALWPDR